MELFDTTNSHTKIGYIEDVTGLKDALGSEDAKVIIEVK